GEVGPRRCPERLAAAPKRAPGDLPSPLAAAAAAWREGPACAGDQALIRPGEREPEHHGIDRDRGEGAHRGPGDVVLDDLAAGLAGDPLQLPSELLLRLLALADRLEVEVVNRDPPLEGEHQQDVVDRLEEIDGVPALVRIDPHDLVAEILVLAE